MTRKEVIWWVNHLFKIRKEEYFNKGMIKDAKEVEEAQTMVLEALSAEAEQVVRCKNCKYQEHCYQTVSHTKIHDGFKEHWSEPIEWCSRGERKGGDSE